MKTPLPLAIFILLVAPLVLAGCITESPSSPKEGDRTTSRIVRVVNVTIDDPCQRWLVRWLVHPGGPDVSDADVYQTESVHYVDSDIVHVILASKATTVPNSFVGIAAQERYETGSCAGWYITSLMDEETHAKAITNWTTSRPFSYSGLVEPEACPLYTVPCVRVGEGKDAHHALEEAGPRTVRVRGSVSWSPLPGETLTLFLFAKDTLYEFWHENGGTTSQTSPLDFDFTHDDETYYQIAVRIQTQAGGASREHAFDVTGRVEDTVA